MTRVYRPAALRTVLSSAAVASGWLLLMPGTGGSAPLIPPAQDAVGAEKPIEQAVHHRWHHHHQRWHHHQRRWHHH